MIPEILKKRMHQVQDFIRKGDHKMKKTLLFIFLICIIFTSCSDNSFDYTVYECLTGIYGLNIPSSNHKQEIIRTTEYTDNTIISSKKIFFEERDYNLNYTRIFVFHTKLIVFQTEKKILPISLNLNIKKEQTRFFPFLNPTFLLPIFRFYQKKK